MTTSQTLRFASTTITSLIGTSTSSSGDPDDDIPDPLTNPATSRIVKVTIACAIVVLGITGLITGFKASLASPKSHSDCTRLNGYIARFHRLLVSTDHTARPADDVPSKRPSPPGAKCQDG